MSTPDDVRRLVPLALSGAAELLGTPVDKLPAGLQGLLENFGAACYEQGQKRAHNADTIPYPEEETVDTNPPSAGGTNPSFPPPAESLIPVPGTPSVFTRPTVQPPKGKRKPPQKLPPPPRLPKGLKDSEK